MKAQDLISAKRGAATALPSEELLEELRQLCEYNDACSSVVRRVSWRSAVKMLTEGGYPCGYDGLQRICVHLGRKSWGVK